MKNLRFLFCVALAMAPALFPFVCPAQNASGNEGTLSFNAADLCGKWKVESPDGYSSNSSRVFEFFPDGRLVETSSFSSSQGETTNAYKKSWSVAGNKVLITLPGESGSNGQSITIDIP